MAEYIDREKIIDEFLTDGAFFIYGKGICKAIISRIKLQPAASVAPVVLCKNCKYSTPPSVTTQLYGEPGTLTCHYGPCNRRNVNENDFCSYGAKMDGDADE